MKEGLLIDINLMQEFFHRGTNWIEEEHGSFVAAEGAMNVAQQIAHVAQTNEWFLEGMLDAFDMDFSKHWDAIKDYTSVSEARAWFDRSIEEAKKVVSELSEEKLQEKLPEGPVMGGAPRFAVISAMSEHTAHHRGALTVYARLAGKVASMPYGEGL